MQFDDVDSNDFNLYFGGCFSYLKESKKAIEILGTDFDARDNLVISYSEIGSPKKTLKFKGAGEKVSFTPLDLGAINLPSSVVLLNRKTINSHPYKYQRLLSNRTLRVFDPFKKERELLRSPPVINSKDKIILNAWVNNEYVSAQEALDNVLSNKRIAQAFSKEYYFGINYTSNSVCLYKNKLIIGKVDSKTQCIHIRPTAIPLKESLYEFGLNIKELDR